MKEAVQVLEDMAGAAADAIALVRYRMGWFAAMPCDQRWVQRQVAGKV